MLRSLDDIQTLPVSLDKAITGAVRFPTAMSKKR